MRIIILMSAIMLIASNGANAQTLQPDNCGATPMQSFIGKPKAKLPVNLPKGTRVLCNTCAATMDYSAGRLNVIYDSKTGLVTQVRCG